MNPAEVLRQAKRRQLFHKGYIGAMQTRTDGRMQMFYNRGREAFRNGLTEDKAFESLIEELEANEELAAYADDLQEARHGPDAADADLADLDPADDDDADFDLDTPTDDDDE